MPPPPVSPVRFEPMCERVAVVMTHAPIWMHHEFTIEEAIVLAGALARAITTAAAWTDAAK